MKPIAKLLLIACAASLCAGPLAAQPTPAKTSPDRVAAFYFGNSLTGCSDPKWHKELGASAGKQWGDWAFLGAGWQLWQHLHALQNSGVEMKRDNNGDLTISPEEIGKTTAWNVKQFYTIKWDAIVLQPFGMALTWKTKEMWGVKFDQETDVGDIASASAIIEIYLTLNPQGRVFIYQDWPAMEPGKVPPPDQLPDWAKLPNARLKEAEFPQRDKFDYAKEWAEAKYEPSTDPEKVWLQKGQRSKDYQDRLFAAVKAKYPDLWRSGRLRAIPVGDIFLALHRKMKDGQFPGCSNVADYYTDVQHIHAGLPRYTVAASFYASLFGERPDQLDWKLYNSRERYAEGKPDGNDPSHDKGELFEITPERVKIVNDAIWETIARSPDATPPKE